MDKMEVAARFIAFTTFLNREDGNLASPGEAGCFARKNWTAFLPYTTEDLGNFLTEIPVLRLPAKRDNALRKELSMAR
jgi:hypothetical protein